MLKPEYFDNKEDRLLELYQKLEDFILKDVARRLIQAGDMTATADRLIYKMEQMGESKNAILAELRRYTGLMQSELKELLQNAVLTSWADDNAVWNQIGVTLSYPLDNAAVITVMDAEYKKTQSELENLTRTTINQSNVDLINMMDEADVKIAAGVQSYNAAINQILDRYAGRGVIVDYPTGARRTLESAVRCAVITSMNQTAAQVSNQYVIEAGAEYILTSAHYGARIKKPGQPDLAGHDLWQGKVFKIRGSEPGYPNLAKSTGYDIDPDTGEGRVVDPRGMHGFSCRHSHRPWDKRLKNPYIDADGKPTIDRTENKTHYELQQKQRELERGIRKTKRELIVKKEEVDAASGSDKDALQADYDRLAYKLTQQNGKYNDFCQTNDLATQYERNRVTAFTRAQEKLANQGAKRYMKNNK